MAEISMKPSTDSDSWCSTYFAKDIEHTFVWDIHRFKDRADEPGDFVYSSVFTVTGDDQTSKWKLKMFPNGEDKTKKNQISLYLEKVSEKNVLVNQCTLSIIKEGLDLVLTKTNLGKTSFSKHSPSWGFAKFIEKGDHVYHNATQDKLSIQCKLQLTGNEKKMFGSKKPEEQVGKKQVLTECKKKLREDLQKLLLSKENSDLEITCNGKVFQCHQLLLQSRSPVFKAMFANAMKELSTHKVVIDDVDPDIFGEMLEYIYTGTAPNAGDNPEELLAAADKYQLMELKNLCEVELCDSLQVDNAVAYLILADLYRIPKLKKVSMQLVVKNMAAAVKSDDWKERLTKNDSLIREVLEMIAENSLK